MFFDSRVYRYVDPGPARIGVTSKVTPIAYLSYGRDSLINELRRTRFPEVALI